MVVRMRATRAHTRKGRSHDALDKPAISMEKKSGTLHMRHRASAITGTYRGRQVMDVGAKILKKEEKRKLKLKERGKEVDETKAETPKK